MTKDECIKQSNNFVIVEHNGFYAKVSPTGIVYDISNPEKVILRKWHYNNDGYAVVSLVRERKWATVGVHILVAKGWVPNPENKLEVNHLDFDRRNPWAYNLEWVTHKENVSYSHKAGRYVGRFGKDNPNYGNNTLHLRYLEDKDLAKEKQSRPGGKNGRAKPCQLFHTSKGLIGTFEYQRDAVYYLIRHGIVKKGASLESVIYYLKREQGYKEYYLRLI